MESVAEAPGAILTRVRLRGVTRDFSPRVNFRCRLSCCSHTAQCDIACINICLHVKITDTGSHTIVWTHEKILHTLAGVGSAALAAALPFQGMGAHIFCNGLIMLPKQQRNLSFFKSQRYLSPKYFSRPHRRDSK